MTHTCDFKLHVHFAYMMLLFFRDIRETRQQQQAEEEKYYGPNVTC